MRTGGAKTASPGWWRRRTQRLPPTAGITTAAGVANGARIRSGMTAEGEAGAGVSVAERRDDGGEWQGRQPAPCRRDWPVPPPLSPAGDISPSKGERGACGDVRIPVIPYRLRRDRHSITILSSERQFAPTDGARPSPRPQAVIPAAGEAGEPGSIHFQSGGDGVAALACRSGLLPAAAAFPTDGEGACACRDRRGLSHPPGLPMGPGSALTLGRDDGGGEVTARMPAAKVASKACRGRQGPACQWQNGGAMAGRVARPATSTMRRDWPAPPPPLCPLPGTSPPQGGRGV